MDDNLDLLFNRIICGETVVAVRGKHYIVRDPTPRYKLIGKHVYEDRYAYFLQDGNLSEAEQKALLSERKIWTENLEKIYKDLYKRKDDISLQIEKSRLQEVSLVNLTKEKELIENDIEELLLLKNSLIYRSAEYLARIEELKYYLFNLTFHFESEKRVWTDMDDYKKEDNSFIRELLQNSYLDNTINDTMIRKLARNEPWRSSWLAAVKTGSPIFGHPTSLMTDFQKSLVSWSLLYDNVYENPDRPAITIIDNDVLLDEWLKEQSDKRNNKEDKYTLGISNPKIAGAQEVGIVVNSAEEAEKVYTLNSPQGKRILEKRSSALNNRGHLKEAHLPDVKTNLQMEMNKFEKEAVKGRMKKGK